MTNPIVPRRFLPVFVALVSCFALWGLLNNMTDNLVPAFQKIFRTSQSTAGYVQVSFYGAKIPLKRFMEDCEGMILGVPHAAYKNLKPKVPYVDCWNVWPKLQDSKETGK